MDEETNAEPKAKCLPVGTMAGRKEMRRRHSALELHKAALRPEQSATERSRPAASHRSARTLEGTVASPQNVAEDEHKTGQLYLPRIRRQRPVSDATTDLKKLRTNSPTTSLLPPRQQRKREEIATNFS